MLSRSPQSLPGYEFNRFNSESRKCCNSLVHDSARRISHIYLGLAMTGELDRPFQNYVVLLVCQTVLLSTRTATADDADVLFPTTFTSVVAAKSHLRHLP